MEALFAPPLREDELGREAGAADDEEEDEQELLAEALGRTEGEAFELLRLLEVAEAETGQEDLRGSEAELGGDEAAEAAASEDMVDVS